MDDMTKILSPLLATFLGALLAFYLARAKQQLDEQKAQVSAGNRALFQLHRMYSTVWTLRTHWINPARENPQRWMMMDSPPPGMVERVKFNFDALGFFLDHPSKTSPTAQVLSDLLILETQFAVAIDVLDLRAKTITEELIPAIHKQVNTEPVHQIVKTFHRPIHDKLSVLTDEAVTRMDELVKAIEETYPKMQTALKFLHPKGKLIELKFPKP